MSQLLVSLKVFWALWLKEAIVFKKDHMRNQINLLCWLITFLTPAMFFLPAMGIQKDFALILLPAGIASWGMFEIITNATTLVSDILGNRVIEYELTLPIPQWAIFTKIALVNAYRAFIVSLLLIPAGMTIIYLGIGMTFSNINLFKTILMILIANVFFGFLGLFTASLMQKISDVRNMWMRVLFPMWFIGGLNNSLSAVQKVAPTFAKVLLLNPIIYISEGMRAAMLGQEGFLNYWICCLVLVTLTIIIGVFAVKRFKKKLDCL
ncbi:MAG: hypothetical protein EBU90_23205 [Proteobacteria bacterium]|nr:hypothetical protein [Pseudomonadota bacterium]NBP14896.1 hypothetical protein [bacterium]